MWRRAIGGEACFFVQGFLLLALLDELRPHFQLFRPDGLGGWHEAALHHSDAGMVSVSRLDDFEHESDGSLLITAQVLTPPTLLLARIGECATPSVLRKASSTFSTTGLVVTRHEAVAEDGERIPYFPDRARRATNGQSAGTCHRLWRLSGH